MEYISILLLGASLSIDAFSFAIAYGMQNLSIKKMLITSLLVGFFHFIMPLIGANIGYVIYRYISISPKIVLTIILLIIAYEIYKSDNEENMLLRLNLFNTILFSIIVSLDSLTAGLGLKYLSENLVLSSLLISVVVAILTFTGFFLGNKIYGKIEKKSKIVSVAILLCLVLYTLCK